MADRAKANPNPLEGVYRDLEKLLARHAPPFRRGGGAVRGKRDFHLLAPKPVVIPGSYGGKPTEIAMASLILQKGYVGFYFTGCSMSPALKKKLSPALLALLKGKTCFHVKALDAGLREDIAAALKLGTALFAERGWIGK